MKKLEQQKIGKKKNTQEDRSMVRTDMVAYYKNKIALGEYVTKSEEIAEKMVQKIKEQPVRQQGIFVLSRL